MRLWAWLLATESALIPRGAPQVGQRTI